MRAESPNSGRRPKTSWEAAQDVVETSFSTDEILVMAAVLSPRCDTSLAIRSARGLLPGRRRRLSLIGPWRGSPLGRLGTSWDVCPLCVQWGSVAGEQLRDVMDNAGPCFVGGRRVSSSRCGYRVEGSAPVPERGGARGAAMSAAGDVGVRSVTRGLVRGSRHRAWMRDQRGPVRARQPRRSARAVTRPPGARGCIRAGTPEPCPRAPGTLRS